ncbi:putative lipid II flippase FtsW [Nocardioides sp. ChNu-153]|uniref:putative lipid II flippase FtsW n=1 Tax=unclassified Nocardioides TaxID=2615069 RepID=UPI0024061293|nr:MULTISPECIES: putative lipid II flippase FtsW [unclassified Nocardioides]MDF9716556.1 putative lipid II flippase FtsW [Nocardioides sp. ChNu-99]MDN7120897.1 putative lipid II flippase FtsW [Nocardioides sp. ChNu-153]
MTTTQEPPVRRGRTGATAVPAEPAARGRLAWTEPLRRSLERPLTSYYLLLGASALLLTIGLVMVLSASSVYSYRLTGDSYGVVRRQLMWAAIGLVVALVVARLPMRLVRRATWLALPVVLVLLALTQTGLGVEVNGNTNWLALGPVQIQPSELAKLTIVLWAADVYANKERVLDRVRHMLVPVVPVVGLIIVLVLLQRDLGTALVLLAILLAMLWVVGAPLRFFALALSVVAVGVVVLATTSAERVKRITNFLDPFADFHDAGWQPAHGLFALSSGGLLGQGIGASQQKWGDLPEAHTDFIFAVLGEELGLVGTLLVLGLFLTIAFAAIRVASTTADPFVRYAGFGIVVWLLGQAMINLGMVLTLLPVIGIPLPLVSYGGSALVPSLVALGLLITFARREPGAAAALEARRRAR